MQAIPVVDETVRLCASSRTPRRSAKKSKKSSAPVESDFEEEEDEDEEHATFAVGEKVSNAFNLRGVVTSVNDDGTYNVKYNDNRTDINLRSRQLNAVRGKQMCIIMYVIL